MNKEIKTKWVAALRSGEYTQGFDQLREITKLGVICHCVLGVLVDVFAEEKSISWNELREDVYMIPIEVSRWANIKVHEARVIINGDNDTLYEHNDSLVGFLKLADAIENQL